MYKFEMYKIIAQQIKYEHQMCKHKVCWVKNITEDQC